MEVSEWLKMAAEVTEAHIKKHGSKWPVIDQLKHAAGEVIELAVVLGESNAVDVVSCAIWALPQAKPLISKHFLEEGWDIIYSTLAAMHIKGFTAEEIEQGGIDTLNKIRRRQSLEEVKV